MESEGAVGFPIEQKEEKEAPSESYITSLARLLGYNYLGPGTPGTTEYYQSHPPLNALDAAAQIHDARYADINDAYHRAVAAHPDREHVFRNYALTQTAEADEDLARAAVRYQQGFGLDPTPFLTALAMRAKIMTDKLLGRPSYVINADKSNYRVALENLSSQSNEFQVVGDVRPPALEPPTPQRPKLKRAGEARRADIKREYKRRRFGSSRLFGGRLRKFRTPQGAFGYVHV